MHRLKRIVAIAGLFFFGLVTLTVTAHPAPTSEAGAPSPWFTGPLLAPSGHTIPAGHTNYEPYLFYTNSFGVYNKNGKVVHTTVADTLSPTMIVTHGLTDHMDIQAVVPFDANWKGGQSDARFGDATLIIGYQLMNQKAWKPDLRMTLSETFPTGHYDHLNPSLNGTDATGGGSYQTSIGAHFQELWSFANAHYLRGRLSFVYTIASAVDLKDFNAFGGGFNTNGTLHLGNHFSTDLAFEYTITRHWVPAIDFYYGDASSGRFNGAVGVTASGLPATISTRGSDLFSIAPAIEYNFNAQLGIIVGGWFSVSGRSSGDFDSAVMAINYYS